MRTHGDESLPVSSAPQVNSADCRTPTAAPVATELSTPIATSRKKVPCVTLATLAPPDSSRTPRYATARGRGCAAETIVVIRQGRIRAACLGRLA